MFAVNRANDVKAVVSEKRNQHFPGVDIIRCTDNPAFQPHNGGKPFETKWQFDFGLVAGRDGNVNDLRRKAGNLLK